MASRIQSIHEGWEAGDVVLFPVKYNSRNSARLKTNRNIFQILDEYIFRLPQGTLDSNFSCGKICKLVRYEAAVAEWLILAVLPIIVEHWLAGLEVHQSGEAGDVVLFPVEKSKQVRFR